MEEGGVKNEGGIGEVGRVGVGVAGAGEGTVRAALQSGQVVRFPASSEGT